MPPQVAYAATAPLSRCFPRCAPRSVAAVVALLGASMLIGCNDANMRRDGNNLRVIQTTVSIENVQTCPDLGSAQGLAIIDKRIYAYGDAETGIIREYLLGRGRVNSDAPYLYPTGRAIRLTQRGIDLIPHPTGLTHHPKFGTFIGNTVGGKGRIFQLDWDRALADGNLDHAVLNVIDDDIAVNGTRPEFVRRGDTWLIATADYGDVDNHVRYYDPALLARVNETSAPGVLIKKVRCGPFVQTLHWIDEEETLLLVQNQIAGLRYRLTPIKPWDSSDYREFAPLDIAGPTDELEGFVQLPNGWGMLLSSSENDNARAARFYFGDTPPVATTLGFSFEEPAPVPVAPQQ